MNDTDKPQMPTAQKTAGSERAFESPLWMRLLLVVSLALNLLTIGALVGAVLTRPSPHGRQRGNGDPAAAFYLGALPSDKRREIGSIIRQNMREYRNDHGALAAGIEETATLLRSEVIDAETIRLAFREQRETLSERRDISDGLFAEYLAKMSLEERRDYADRLEQALERFNRR